MKKNLVVYFAKEGEWEITHPYEGIRPGIEEKQEALLNAIPESVNIYIVRSEKFHTWWNMFRPQFKRENKLWIPYEWDIVEADLVIGFNIPKKVTRIFDTIREISHDKTILESLFPEYTLPSIRCENYEDIEKNFHSIQTQLKVLKPIKWTRSKGIFIWENIPQKEEIWEEYFPYILQEFFDTSGGFYDFPWLHDFRVVMLDGQIIWKFLRQPESGKYTANSFRRWWFINLKDWEIPKELQKIIFEIETYCEKRFTHRYYSIDFGMWTNQELKIFEINSAPGLTNDALAATLGSYIAKNILKVS